MTQQLLLSFVDDVTASGSTMHAVKSLQDETGPERFEFSNGHVLRLDPQLHLPLCDDDVHSDEFLIRRGNFSSPVRIGTRPLPTFNDEELADLQGVHDAAVQYYAKLFEGEMGRVLCMPDGTDDDILCVQHLAALLDFTHDVDGLDPAFGAFALAECERFQTYMTDVDPASKVAWLTADGGLYLFIGGHNPANTMPIREAIAGNSALLGKSGIQLLFVQHSEDVIRIFVPYEGQIVADPS